MRVISCIPCMLCTLQAYILGISALMEEIKGTAALKEVA